MKELLSLLRAMQLFAHSAHHLCKGESFFSDHKFFGSTYTSLETDYDDLAERIIGLYGDEPLNIQVLMTSVCQKLSDAPSASQEDNKVFFEYQLKLEGKLCAQIKQIIAAGVGPGVEQLIGEQCNKSEARQFKIKRRLK